MKSIQGNLKSNPAKHRKQLTFRNQELRGRSWKQQAQPVNVELAWLSESVRDRDRLELGFPSQGPPAPPHLLNKTCFS